MIDSSQTVDPSQPPPALRLEGLHKRFGDAVVLDDVSLTVQAGEVMAFAGANGSGKSTTVKVITGVYSPTRLERIEVGGTAAQLPITRAGLHRLGVRVVHQSLGLVDGLDVADNVALAGGYATDQVRGIRWRRTRERVSEVLHSLGVDVSPTAKVGELAAWQRVAVAVARVFYGGVGNTKLVLLDEVTAAMPSEEVARLFDLLRRLTAGNVGVLYVTHRFEEIFAIADRVTVIRDGHVARSSAVSEVSKAELVASLAGTEPAQESVVERRAISASDSGGALTLKGVSGRLLRDLSLTVRHGEIVGVTGRAGCGKSELGRIAFGLQEPVEGEVRYDGYSGAVRPRSLIAAGICYVPPDRKRLGLITGGTVRENLTLPFLRRYGSPLHLDLRGERKAAISSIERYKVVPPDPEAPVDSLSGGNQQKVVLARWMLRRPKALILDDPTEGVDVPARSEIYAAIREAAREGTAVLVLTSDPEEVVELCDRVVVLAEGRQTVEFEGAEIEINRLSRRISEGGISVG